MRAGAHDAPQLEVRRRLELCAGEDPQSVTGGRLAAGGHGREREQELVEDAVGEQPPREVWASLAQNGVDGEALAHDRESAGEVDAVDAWLPDVVHVARGPAAGSRQRR